MSRESSPPLALEPDGPESSPLSAESEAAVLAALEAALRPQPLDPAINERLIELALLDPLAPPSEEELVESARLRDALEGAASSPDAGQPEHEDAAVLRALTAAFGAKTPGSAAETAAAETAAEQALPPSLKSEPRASNVIYVAFGSVSLALAAAAAVLLTFTARVPLGDSAAESTAAAALIKPHSTAPLFTDRFDMGGTTARMDLIASERARDLRDNRFKAWGVR